MAVTQRQIAEHLGLSHQAVNFALGHRSHMVSAKTRQRVRDAAKQLGYRTNTAAAAISTGKFNTIGLLLSQHVCQSTISGQLLRGINDVLETRGLQLAITVVDDARLTSDEHLPRILGQAMVDGLLLNYTHAIPARMVELIDRHQTPAVWLNSPQAANCVYPDDKGAAEEATGRLLQAGHRNITFLDLTAAVEDSHEIHYSHAARRDGYECAMRKAGVQPQVLIGSGRQAHRTAVEAAVRILGSDNRPTAIAAYCRQDTDALLLAAAQLGIRIGPDLSLILFEKDQPLIGPLIDTMLLPDLDVGRAATEQLLERLGQPHSKHSPKAIPMIYKHGETIMPPR